MTMSTQSTPTKQFRLLVADIDGTLVTSSREITPRVLDAVRAAQRKRVRVCLATGRIWPSAEPYFRRLGADPPAILYNGGLVYDFRTDTVLRRVPLDYHQAKLVLELLREFPAVQPFLYVGDRVYTTKTSLDTERYRRKDSLTGVAMGNAPPELRAQAGYVTSTNDKEGLAEVIERVILNPKAST